MRRLFSLLAGSAILASAVVAAQPYYPQPAPGQQQGRVLNPKDVADAQHDNPVVVQELGGQEIGQRAQYVSAVGQKVAAYSGVANPGQQLHFTLLNSAVENALSVPGGYVYVTRQLMGIMDDESELAFALGHEVGHIAADHARAREAYQQRGNVLGVLGQILGAVIGSNVFGGMIGQGAERAAEMRTLGFSRDQEYQADELGMRYMVQAGYDPGGAGDLLAALTRATALETRMQGRTNRQTPEWASTHPLSQNRAQRAYDAARQSGLMGTGVRNRDAFLSRIEGMYIDDDPAQGIIDGPVFTHPNLGMQFQVPAGYLMSNGSTAVTISGSAGKAQFGGGRSNGSLEDYILRVYRELTDGQQLAIPQPRRTVINGLPAAVTTARIQTQSNTLDASVVAYQWAPGRIYHFVMLTPAGYGVQPFSSMISSLRKISAAEAAAIKPRVIHVVTVGRGDTVQSLSARMAYRDYKLDRFLTLNGLAANSALVPGQKVKLVVYGARRG